MFKKDILIKIKEIKRLEEAKFEPYRKVKRKFLKEEILNILPENPLKIGDYILVKEYTNQDKTRPYFQIFTQKTWEIHKDWVKNNQGKL